MTGNALVARLDSAGDVLLAGPAVRAVAQSSARVTMLVGPRGRAAAELLPGVDDIIEWQAPWVDFEHSPVTAESVHQLIKQVETLELDRALILTSFHQSPLPLALVLRMAAVPWIGAISEDYPGALLDLRHHVGGDPPEAERALSLATAAGYALPAGDRGRLEVRRPLPDVSTVTGDIPYIVVHPGAAVPARRMSVDRSRDLVRGLVAAGLRVLVTGTPGERDLTRDVAGDWATDLGGATDMFEMAAILAGARVLVAPNTGPAHLAAAVGTPVVSLFAPVVPADRWAPYGVPHRLLGRANAPCAGTRARECPVPGHPCLDAVTTEEVLAAIEQLTAHPDVRTDGGGTP
ncbi:MULTISPECIES: glycosyltransferase family 9 protein [Rhodococcus]|uniref:Glycosyltransferase family 9 protein n=1 Tax=Rhodococcus oxybenzonivorans TaxID=1990687 RepID=A0AAE4V397_9NOCA|nr:MULTISPECIES: glycosyltransferase family 9 protein [Rhodococcus]MDV7242345.1 glycosyltransferase family 9 protein [Rhodococcus oxybenzonivorans]MDV7267535.1 glycosyltransferase family 9 protein [Rhodococcus oxybenzonivorans]MDV7277092.1 glycosyltransferase family 9 protein [Rhodococcus oxybenzonivorans]MDV7331834.1 glycosyltransferase family 9 protein [Rhodococcus oxybenzonivorans]MDV7344055.1 glycosyltransferase family 9 protein [Rhodococcus oxybenzonivorans]